jgi:hypothetical protein
MEIHAFYRIHVPPHWQLLWVLRDSTHTVQVKCIPLSNGQYFSVCSESQPFPEQGIKEIISLWKVIAIHQANHAPVSSTEVNSV